jgi:hypothetical protein
MNPFAMGRKQNSLRDGTLCPSEVGPKNLVPESAPADPVVPCKFK